jgi:uncharacterized cupin superfamily protein
MADAPNLRQESFLELKEMSKIHRDFIQKVNTNSKLKPSPIEPSWIIEGNPIAQSSLISKSSDGLAWTVVWHCSEGKFNWYYNMDESLLILEGSIVLESDTMSPTRYGPGDTIFFRNGAHARWHVEQSVRKLAFCRKMPPAWVGFGLRLFSKIKRTIMPARSRKAISLMSS